MASKLSQSIFGTIIEKNVYFLIDTSGSMYKQLPFVKEHLTGVLTKRALHSKDTMFNIIEFKEDIDKWADKLVQCTPTTVSLAQRWIEKLTSGTSTNTMAALLEAFNDRAAEAVYIVTDGLPDQRPSLILEKIQGNMNSIAVHSIYLNGTNSDPAAHDFLRDLAEQTRGSFHTVTLSNDGEIERVVPVYKSGYFERYSGAVVSSDYQRKPYIELKQPAPSEYVSKLYTRTPVPTVGLSLPLSHTLYSDQDLSSERDVSSKMLDYADAVLEAKCLATSAGIRSCSTPVACLLMKGMKVLARYDPDGLYYLGEVKEQGRTESFIVKFDQCPGMRKTVVQETSVGHMIAYKDAIRSHVSLGDKVLAPWQKDGRYGPGTVLDGIDRRDVQYEGERGGELLVTFFNGETVQVRPGIAVRIPHTTYERIARELQLPESQRRKLKFITDESIPPSYDDQQRVLCGREPHPPRSITKAWQEKKIAKENERLRQNIDKQIRENNYLLHALDLGENLYHPEILGKATSAELRGYDSGIFSDDGSGTSDNESKTTDDDRFRNDARVRKYNKHYDLGHRLRFSLPDEVTKSKRQTEPKKPWKYWSSGSSATQPSFRHTLLEKPREPGDKLANTAPRPGHEEYKTVAGVSFPAGTDRKFGPKSQVWHPYRQLNHGKQKENIPTVWKKKHLKHSEYQDVSGVRFPSKTDKKFTRSIDPNWRPETALENAERQQNWEDSLGHGDAEKNSKYEDKLERKRSNQRRYFKDIEDKVAVDEKKEEKRIGFRRQRMAGRDDNLAEAYDEENKERANRIANKTTKQAELLRSEQERTEKIENLRNARIEFRRERQERYLEIEEQNDTAKESRVTKRQIRRQIKEYERREEFHERLREEWKKEDDRIQVPRQKNEEQRAKEEKRTEDVEQMKQARLAARQERLERYRARIFPG